jgi:malate synthase
MFHLFENINRKGMSLKVKIDTSSLHITGITPPEYEKILTPGTILFLKSLHLQFNGRRKELLEKRKIKQKEIDSGVFPTFLSETEHIGTAIGRLLHYLCNRRDGGTNSD